MVSFKKFIWELHSNMVILEERKFISKFGRQFTNSGNLLENYSNFEKNLYNIFTFQKIFVKEDYEKYPYLEKNFKDFYNDVYLKSNYYFEFIEYWKVRGDDYAKELKRFSFGFIEETTERYIKQYVEKKPKNV